jgi:hypothetical protein
MHQPVFTRASDDPTIPATSVAILSLLPSTAAPFLSGTRAKRAAFSPLALVAAQSAPSPNHSLNQTQAQWRSATGRRSGDAVMTRPVSVVTRPWSTTVETLRRCDGLVKEG